MIVNPFDDHDMHLTEDYSLSSHNTTSRMNSQHPDFEEQEEDVQDLISMQTLVKSFDQTASITASSLYSTSSLPPSPVKSSVKKCMELDALEQEFEREYDQLESTLGQLASSG